MASTALKVLLIQSVDVYTVLRMYTQGSSALKSSKFNSASTEGKLYVYTPHA